MVGYWFTGLLGTQDYYYVWVQSLLAGLWWVLVLSYIFSQVCIRFASLCGVIPYIFVGGWCTRCIVPDNSFLGSTVVLGGGSVAIGHLGLYFGYWFGAVGRGSLDCLVGCHE